MKKMMLCLLVLALLLAMAGCGTKEPAETTAAAQTSALTQQELALTDWSMTASTWSSPNGATVHLTATPVSHEDGQSAAFLVRLEGENVATVPCEWDGTHYTASAELNADDGLCYYVQLTSADGASTAEISVNTPNEPYDEALINMSSSLQSYCNLTVTESEMDGDKLTLTSGNAQIQLPRITNQGEEILCRNAVLVLTFEGAEVAVSELALPDPSEAGMYDLSVAGATFDIPAMEDDQQLVLRLDVTLSNNQTLTALGATFFYVDGQLLLAVG